LKEQQQELADLANEYSSYTEGELFMQNDYYRLEMNKIEKEFFEKQLAYWRDHSLLRLIYFNAIFLN